MKLSIYIGGIVALQLAVGFATQLLIIRLAGLGDLTDSYFAAQTIPSVAISIIVSALQSAWLPRLSILSGDEAKWKKELATALGQAAVAGIGIFIIFVPTIKYWSHYLYPGFNLAQLESTIHFTIVLLIATFFTLQSALLTISLRSKELFIAAESVTLFGNILSLIAIFYSLPIWGVIAAVWITLFKSVLVFICQLKLAGWPSITLSKGLQSRESLKLIKPLLYGNLILKTSPLVDRYWASQAPTGSITLFNIAQTFIISLASIIERSLCTPLITSFSKYIFNKDYIGLKSAYKKGFLRITICIVVLTLLLILLKPVFLSITSKALNLKQSDSLQVWNLLAFSVGYLHAIVTGSLLVAVFYALNDTKKPMYISLFGFIFSLVLKMIGFNYFSLNGLAAASSIYLLINVFFYFYFIEQKLKKIQSELNHEH